MKFKEFLAKEVDGFLKKHRISNIQFAEAYGTTPNYVSQMRNGHRSIDIDQCANAVAELGFGFHLRIERGKHLDVCTLVINKQYQ